MTVTHPPLYLGIDTGGTFTDGVLLNPETRCVLKTAKVLTTHHELKLCIAAVLDALQLDEVEDIRLVSLSTTLATNAIAEGKSKPVALLLLGYDPDLVRQFGFERQFGASQFSFVQGKYDYHGIEQVPLDKAEVERIVTATQEDVYAYAVASYEGPTDASHEEQADEIISRLSRRPVVLAHHLSSNLDSIRRAATARLNASLLSEAHDFVAAAREMLAARGIRCPLMMVRGDGSLVKASFAARRPVEIIHSGPATSSIGGRFLAGLERALVIDIGGTTTDLALVDGSELNLQGEATVGGFHTCVKTIHARSFGLGGDSLIQFAPAGSLAIGPGRVTPLAYFAYAYPHLKNDLLEWLHAHPRLIYSDRLECWRLVKNPRSPVRNAKTRKALELLEEGPATLPHLLKHAGAVSPVQLERDSLLQHEVIERAALTPTDLLHVTGAYTPWDREIPRLVVQNVARSWELTADEFIERVTRRMTGMITAEVIHYLSGMPLDNPFDPYAKSDLGNWLFHQNLAPQHAYLGSQIQLKLPIIGIGAPAKVFLPPVAQALGAEIVFPDHFEVANAVGAVVGNVLVRLEAEVMPFMQGMFKDGYFCRAANSQKRFASLPEALEHARQTLLQQARSDAQSAGAVEPEIELEEQELMPGTEIFRLSACAVGKPGVNGSG